MDFQVPLGGGAYFNPFGRGGGQGGKSLPMQVQSATRPSRTASQMSQDLESSLQAQQILEAQRRQRVGLMGADPDADARDKEESRLSSIVEELAPRDQRERYMGAALGRGATNEIAERAGKVGVLGRTAGAGVAGGLAGLSALMSLQNAGAQGQDAITGIGQSALRGAGTFSTLNPTLQEVGGAIGSRLGGTNYGPAANMAGAVVGGAADMAGRAGGRIADATRNFTENVRSRLAPPTPGFTLDDEEESTEQRNPIAVLGPDTQNPVDATRAATNAARTHSIDQSMAFDPLEVLGPDKPTAGQLRRPREAE